MPRRRAAAFPTGTFETKITPADVRSVAGPGWWAHWETLTYKNGKFADVWFHPRRADQPTTSGSYAIHGNRLYTYGGPGHHDVFRWSYYRGELTLQPLNTPDLDQLGILIFTAHPWQKIS